MGLISQSTVSDAQMMVNMPADLLFDKLTVLQVIIIDIHSHYTWN